MARRRLVGESVRPGDLEGLRLIRDLVQGRDQREEKGLRAAAGGQDPAELLDLRRRQVVDEIPDQDDVDRAALDRRQVALEKGAEGGGRAGTRLDAP